MKISRNWLNDYIESDKSDKELSDLFTQLGLECNLETNDSNLSEGIIIGKVLSCKKHPNADRLKLCLVDVGEEEPLEIICGAPNVTKNIKVPVATLGTFIGNIKIKKTKIRGVTSNGMICSEKELELGDNHDGIMILDSKCKVGEKFSSIIDTERHTIFDFDMTPNRGDCFSHLGIARELSIIENKKIKLDFPKFPTSNFCTSKVIKVNIKKTNICKRYSCIAIKNIKVKESPLWLKKKLESIGQKSINNVVDLANFIMFDLGQPLHVFDLDKIKGSQIDVRLASKNEKIVTLDSETKDLKNKDIIISDSKGPIAIAGVIGGLNSHVDENTKNILVESAIFNPIYIRRTAKIHDCSTEASKRFERGIDYENVVYSIYKFSCLLKDISDCEVACDHIDEEVEERQNYEIVFDVVKCNSFLGTSLSSKEMKNIFNSLNIECSKEVHSFKCSIPKYRNDLQRDVDLYEEIARVYGYDNISPNLNFNFPSNCFVKDESLIEDRMRMVLSSNGFNEHYSNSLYSEELISLAPTKPIKIKNPLSRDMAYLRNSLLPGILKALLFNEKRENNFLKIFEIGSIIEHSNKPYNSSIEKRMICMGYLLADNTTWKNQNLFDIYDVKGDVKMLINNLGLHTVCFESTDEQISVIIENNFIGKIYNLNEKNKSRFKFDNDVIICEMHIDNLISNLEKRKIKYKPVIPFPSIKRDIAILVSEKIKHKQIVDIINNASSNLLKDIRLFDLYIDKSLGENSKSLAYSLKFQSDVKTLTVSDIEKEINLILKDLKNNLNAIQR